MGFWYTTNPGVTGEVSADLEGGLVAHLNAAAGEVPAQVLEPLRQTHTRLWRG